jgi:2-iminobutanoate/2-iminopropanoate deaminase
MIWQIRSTTARVVLQYFGCRSSEIGLAHHTTLDHDKRNHTAVPYQIIDSPRVPSIGPYSQAIRVGCLVFTAGQTGIDPATGIVAGSSFEAQARQAFANLQAVLEDAGTKLAHVIKVTCFVADPDAFLLLNSLFKEFFPVGPPVRSTPLVQLPRGLLFSIDAIAVVGV